MKNLIRLLFATTLLFSFTQFAVAQEKTDKELVNDSSNISVGINIAYGFDIEEPGIQVNGYYDLNEKMRVGVDFLYWFIEDISDVKITLWELHGNFHYLFYDKNDLAFYGIGSLGFYRIEGNADFLGMTISESDVGINLGVGAGLQYNTGGVTLYSELKQFLTGSEQLTLSVGLRIPFWSE